MKTTTINVLGVLVLLAGQVAMAQAQPPRRITVLTPGGAYGPVVDGLREGLARVGLKEGSSLRLAVDELIGDPAEISPRVLQSVKASPDLIVTVTTNHTAAAKAATTRIPIVFTVVGDPVGSKLIDSFASSRNNLTGVTNNAAALSAKRLELLKEIAPRSAVVMTVTSAQDSISRIALKYVEETAKVLKIKIVNREIGDGADLDKFTESRPQGRMDAIFLLPAQLISRNIAVFDGAAKRWSVPLVVWDHALVPAGGLFSYGGDAGSYGVQAAGLALKILKGSKPAEVSVETPDRLVLTVNLGAAKAIGLKIPRAILERAERIVE